MEGRRGGTWTIASLLLIALITSSVNVQSIRPMALSSDLIEACHPTSFDLLGGNQTIARFEPQNLTVLRGQLFTVMVVMENVSNLYGFDVQVKWNTTYLEYLEHTATVPVETYPNGVLHQPMFFHKNEANPTAGTYWLAAASLEPAEPFTGNGTAFMITFRALNQTGTTILNFTNSGLLDHDSNPIQHLTQDAAVELTPGYANYDIAITDLTPRKTVAGQGYSLNVSVTAANQGTFTETINVTLYANTTVIDKKEATVGSGISTTLTFTWNTTGFAKGNYTIWAHAEPILGETGTSDNMLVDGWVFVTIPGDVDGDRDIDIFDIVRMAGAYGTTRPDPKYDPHCDVDDDGDIDIFDIVRAAGNYGKSW